MNRYDIALGKKPPEKPLDEAMRKALDEPYSPTTSVGWLPSGESYLPQARNIHDYNNRITGTAYSTPKSNSTSPPNYSYKKGIPVRIPATGDWS